VPDQMSLPVDVHEGAIREAVEGGTERDFRAIGADAIGMQDTVHFRRCRTLALPPEIGPDARETQEVAAAALEARAMAGSERGRLVEKKQFGVSAWRHDVPMPVVE